MGGLADMAVDLSIQSGVLSNAAAQVFKLVHHSHWFLILLQMDWPGPSTKGSRGTNSKNFGLLGADGETNPRADGIQ